MNGRHPNRRAFALAAIGFASTLVACGGQASPTQRAPETGTVSPSPGPTLQSSVAATASLAPTTPGSPASALVGKWSLELRCEALADAVSKANRPELLPLVITEVIEGGENGTVPSGWDPAKPCANALPPFKHSHTFWPDGRFNSYDENDAEVDRGKWVRVDDSTVKIGDPPRGIFKWSVTGNELLLTPVPPVDCTTSECIGTLSWQFNVAFPGEPWTRQSTGAHIP